MLHFVAVPYNDIGLWQGDVWRVGGGLSARLLEWGALQYCPGCAEDYSASALQCLSS